MLYRLGSRHTGSLLTLVVANATFVAPRPGAAGRLERRYLELQHTHVSSVACALLDAAAPATAAAAAVNPAVVSPAGEAVGGGEWRGGWAAVTSSASDAAVAAARAAMGEAAWAARGCEVWTSWALYDAKWALQVGCVFTGLLVTASRVWRLGVGCHTQRQTGVHSGRCVTAEVLLERS